MPSVYLETTIPSYLAAFPSRDLIVAAHQQLTHDWWRTAQQRFALYISEAVLDEIKAGNPQAAERRQSVVQHLPVLMPNKDVRTLTAIYEDRLGFRGRSKSDLPHFAYAVAYEMDYLVSWNCSHIANGEIIRRVADVNAELGRFMPLIVTPEELIEPEIG